MAIFPVLIGTFVYGILGGFVLQAILGGIAGVLGWRARRTEIRPAWRRCLGLSTATALPGVLTLSVLDWLIGPW